MPVSPLNGSCHNISTVAPFCSIAAAYMYYMYHPRSCDRLKPEAQARQRRTPFGAKETQPIIVKSSVKAILMQWNTRLMTEFMRRKCFFL